MRNVGQGRTAASVVLVGLDNDAMGSVREVLAAEAVLPSSSVSFGDAISVVKRTRPDVVIIGLTQAIDAALALAQALTKEAPGATLIALADQRDAEAILAAVRVGYKEFVVLPEDANRLRQVVHEAAFAPADDDERGLVVAITGAKGGVGTTLLATHLAAELAAIHRVLCMDLDLAVGDVASMMDLTPKDTLIDLLPRADRVDERMLTGAVAVHRSKVHVLGQPTELERTTEINAEDVYSVMAAAAKGYQYIVVDVGVRLDEVSALALSVADVVLLVTTPDVIAVRDAYRRLKHMGVSGVEKERVRLVVNRWSRSAFVKNEDIEANLGLRVMGTVADDARTVDQAINEGKLVRAVNKKSEAARDISTLVALLTDGGEGEAMPVSDEKGGFFFGLFGRG